MKGFFVLTAMAVTLTAAPALAKTQELARIPISFTSQARLDHFETFSYEAGANETVNLNLQFRDERGQLVEIGVEPMPGLEAHSESVVYKFDSRHRIKCAVNSPWVNLGAGVTFTTVGVLTGNPIASGLGWAEIATVVGGDHVAEHDYNVNKLQDCDVVIDSIQPEGEGSSVQAHLEIKAPAPKLPRASAQVETDLREAAAKAQAAATTVAAAPAPAAGATQGAR